MRQTKAKGLLVEFVSLLWCIVSKSWEIPEEFELDGCCSETRQPDYMKASWKPYYNIFQFNHIKYNSPSEPQELVIKCSDKIMTPFFHNPSLHTNRKNSV